MTSQYSSNSNSSSADNLDSFESRSDEDLLFLEDLEDTETEEGFVLLSTYLDGEASSQECRQVEALLATNPKMRQFYDRMLSVRQGLRDIPIPQTELEPMTDRVFAQIDRQAERSWKWGSGAVAALFLVVVSGLAFSTQSYNTQLAQVSIEPENAPSSTISPDLLDGKTPAASLVDKALFVE